MPSESVDEVIVAAVRLIGDHHNIVPLREYTVTVTLLLGKELLDRGEHHAPRSDRELRAEVGTVRSLHRWLAQQVAAAGEGAEELIVEIVSVGEHHEGRVRHRRIEDHGFPRGRSRSRDSDARVCLDRQVVAALLSGGNGLT